MPPYLQLTAIIVQRNDALAEGQSDQVEVIGIDFQRRIELVCPPGTLHRQMLLQADALAQCGR
jgi:hypothetical protein